MEAHIPGADEVRAALAGLGHAQVQELARLSGVPFTTLWKIREGGPKVGGKGTDNPGIETVRMFMPFINEVKKSAEPTGVAVEPGEHAQAAERDLKSQAEADRFIERLRKANNRRADRHARRREGW